MTTSAPPKIAGRPFWKMTGSGNDFLFFDNRTGAHEDLVRSDVISALCDRRRGAGADGIVLIDTHPSRAFGMRYYNRDGSLAEMCGNAALCSASLARELGMAGVHDFSFETPSGPVTARFAGGEPEIDMVPVTELAISFETPLAPGEQRIGYARVGVPHLVVLCDDVTRVNVAERGRALRHLPQLAAGANANFVSREAADRWRMRTYERGVEEETLACGTGTVATVALLNAWHAAEGGIALRTVSGCDVFASATPGRVPVLRGEGRIVYTGLLRDLVPG
ncbi:MAG: diaminopimelate epimerase [Gemmatimonadaceae bacterium]|nr:diaminopimelate epimerase [Gemmatimonadaceae bacterium]